MSGFACMECGYKFKTIKAAERASFGPKGCPKCGGSDIDLAREPKTEGLTLTAMPLDRDTAEFRPFGARS